MCDRCLNMYRAESKKIRKYKDLDICIKCKPLLDGEVIEIKEIKDKK